jgi:hypothetical protein
MTTAPKSRPEILSFDCDERYRGVGYVASIMFLPVVLLLFCRVD